MYVWILPAVFAEHRRQSRQHAGADEADAQEADLAAAYAAGFVEIFLDIAESATGALEEDLACTGETDGARGAGEEGVAEDLFEFANLLREGRLGEVQTQGGTAKVQLFGDGDKVAKVA